MSVIVAMANMAVQSALPPSPVYRVEPFALDARVADAVGPKRMGTLCLPAGSIAWREARPEPGEAREAFARGLTAGGIAVADTGNPFGERAHGAERAIKVSLRGIRLTACVPPTGWGRVLNHSHGVKGDGVIALAWRTYERGTDAPVATGPTCVTFAYKEANATLPTMTLAGLETAGRQVAADLVAQGRQQADEVANCRRLSSQPGSPFVVTGDPG